jgi:hypothetical protein
MSTRNLAARMWPDFPDVVEETSVPAAAQSATDLPEIDPRMRAEIAAYIYQLAGEMTQMARAARLDLLVYFLEMARVQANSHRFPD